MEINELDSKSILEDDVFCEVIEEKDPVFRERLILALTDRAKELGVKIKFDKLLKAHLTSEKKMLSEQKKTPSRIAPQNLENYTEFDNENLPNLYCGNWFADETGVRTFNMFGEVQACYHPILPIEIYTNLETGEKKVKLAFKNGFEWETVTVDREVISSSNKIVGLSAIGVSVTTENGKYLVKYLSDVENFNRDLIPRRKSTTKLGWVNGNFLPYQGEVLFDGDQKFKPLFEDIKSYGDYNKWLNLTKMLRSKKRIEPKIMLAASFASVIIKKCGGLPFFVHLFGDTEGGKTLSLMLAASIWGNPGMESNYLGGFLTTQTALEVRADMLNNLPFFLDDTAQVKQRMTNEEFSTLIYTFCSGKGKDRSNRTLGLNRQSSWHCAFLTTGEKQILDDNSQAGALNRVIEIEAGPGEIITNGIEIAKLLKNNYGFAGRLFIEALTEIGDTKLIEYQRDFLHTISFYEKTQKQSIPLSIILTADYIAEKYIFKDGQTLDIDTVAKMLKSESDISENERCYQYILGEIGKNQNRFTNNPYGDSLYGEIWGADGMGIDDGWIFIIKNVFDKFCAEAKCNTKQFLKWAERNGFLKTFNGEFNKVKKLFGKPVRCVCLKLESEE